MRIPRTTIVGSYATGLTMRVPRLPSTGETLLGTGYRVDYGGKGSNQAVGCARLGCHVDFIAKIGNDAFGEMALNLYREEGIDLRHVARTAQAPTGVGFILVEGDSGHNCIAIDPGANAHLSADDVRACEAAFDGAAVVLTQLEIPSETAEAALLLGRRHGAITILNPAPVRPLSESMLQATDILTPNAVEAKVLAGLAPNATTDLEEVARALIRKGAKKVVMTLGENGAMIVDTSSTSRVAAIRVAALDTTGAGDAFNAGLATALAYGESLSRAVQFGVTCGGLAVSKEGVIPALPRRNEVIRTYQAQGWTPPAWLAAESADGRDGRTIGTRGRA